MSGPLPVISLARSVRLELTRHCELACRFCSRHSRTPGGKSWEELLAALERCPDPQRRRLVLTGGEPVGSPWLLPLVAEARQRGFAEIVLESNGLGWEEDLLPSLTAAGLGRVELLDGVLLHRMGEPGWTATRAEQWAKTWLVQREADAGSEVWLRWPLLAGLAEVAWPHLAELGAGGALPFRGVLADWLTPETLASTGRPCLPWAEAARLLGQLAALCGEHGLAFTWSSPNGLPACLSVPTGRADLAEVAEGRMRSQPDEAHQRIPACTECSRTSTCKGLPIGLLGVTSPQSLAGISAEAWSAASGAEAPRHNHHGEYVDDLSLIARGAMRNAVVRVNYRCQMRCDFCWVDLHGGEKTWEQLLAEVERAVAFQAAEVTFSGGEPTLFRRLPDLIGEVRARGVSRVNIETNAMLFRKPEVTAAYREAGLTDAFVSLHAAEAGVSDALTKVPGGFAQTLVGIRNLLGAGVPVVLNYVISTANLGDLARFPDFLQQEYGALARRLGVRFSVAHLVSDLVQVASVPRLTALREPLRAALLRARELGLTVQEVGGQCGVPPCVLDGDERFFPSSSHFSRSQHVDVNFVKPPVCEQCRFNESCVGLRRGYYERYGAGELRAV